MQCQGVAQVTYLRAFLLADSVGKTRLQLINLVTLFNLSSLQTAPVTGLVASIIEAQNHSVSQMEEPCLV